MVKAFFFMGFYGENRMLETERPLRLRQPKNCGLNFLCD